MSSGRYCAILCGEAPQSCPRVPCVTCVEDIAERAALIADGEKCGQPAATVLARAQALRAMPGRQHALIAG